ncbi:MAG TPA: hypothetical protein DCZ94_03875 [Lentisphaeria bacterium]|nr:MAG: hypothetical protein A2X48_05095 [Lentisphaerae bacterium GWF2_49_21]HBC86073.1 hypothetical protein [Lentisphaeria bacterium]
MKHISLGKKTGFVLLAIYAVIILLLFAGAFCRSNSGENNIFIWLLVYQSLPPMYFLNLLLRILGFVISGLSFYHMLFIASFINGMFLFMIGILIGYFKEKKLNESPPGNLVPPSY